MNDIEKFIDFMAILCLVNLLAVMSVVIVVMANYIFSKKEKRYKSSTPKEQEEGQVLEEGPDNDLMFKVRSSKPIPDMSWD